MQKPPPPPRLYTVVLYAQLIMTATTPSAELDTLLHTLGDIKSNISKEIAQYKKNGVPQEVIQTLNGISNSLTKLYSVIKEEHYKQRSLKEFY